MLNSTLLSLYALVGSKALPSIMLLAPRSASGQESQQDKRKNLSAHLTRASKARKFAKICLRWDFPRNGVRIVSIRSKENDPWIKAVSSLELWNHEPSQQEVRQMIRSDMLLESFSRETRCCVTRIPDSGIANQSIDLTRLCIDLIYELTNTVQRSKIQRHYCE